MDISRIGIDPIKISQNPFQKAEASKPAVSFASVLQGYLENVDQTVKNASELSVQAAAGTVANVHDVTIATQKAKLALELTVAVRDRAVESYQEIMRMQI